MSFLIAAFYQSAPADSSEVKEKSEIRRSFRTEKVSSFLIYLQTWAEIYLKSASTRVQQL